MEHTFLQIDLEFLFGQERDDAGRDEVDETLSVVIHLIFEGPLALRDDKTENFDLTLGIFVTELGCLPRAWDSFQEHGLVASDFLRDKFKDWNEDSQHPHVFPCLVDYVLSDIDGLLTPVLGDVG